LHVAIACALLGKNCELLDNAYNKNREVYAHSLHRFPWLSLKKIAGECIADQPPIKRPLFARVAKHTQRIVRNRASRNGATRGLRSQSEYHLRRVPSFELALFHWTDGFSLLPLQNNKRAESE